MTVQLDTSEVAPAKRSAFWAAGTARLLGPIGIRSLAGLTPPRSGEVTFAGTRLKGLPPHRVAKLGIGLVPEGRRCFAALTVEENLIATARPGKWDFGSGQALEEVDAFRGVLFRGQDR